MFKFNFELEDDEDGERGIDANVTNQKFGSSAQAGPSRPRKVEPCHDVSLDELLSRLPEKISYSPIAIPGGGSILRRDLYDARFQLASEHEPSAQTGLCGTVNDSTGGKSESEGARSTTDGGVVDIDSDLIPGLYEGGLKTWEGGVDLVEVLGRVEDVRKWVSGARILEIGCGTAIPSAHLLRQLLSTPATSDDRPTTFHLQDYNLSVLSLVTLPNLLLAALPHLPAESLRPPEEVDDVEAVVPDLDIPGDVHITSELKTAFKSLLSEWQISLRFTYGAWSGIAENLDQNAERYDLILTAETIYSEDAVDDLVDVLRVSARREKPGHQTVELEVSLDELHLHGQWDRAALKDQKEAVILVGAKVLYFGVGGGLQAFLHTIESTGGWHETVKEWTRGVGRRVVRVGW